MWLWLLSPQQEVAVRSTVFKTASAEDEEGEEDEDEEDETMEVMEEDLFHQQVHLQRISAAAAAATLYFYKLTPATHLRDQLTQTQIWARCQPGSPGLWGLWLTAFIY